MRSSTLYDFYGQDADPRLQHLVRVVHLVLHDVPEGHNISIGKVEVFGYIATPPISPHASWTQYKQAQAEHHVSSIIHKIAGVSLPPSSEGDLEMLVNYSIAEPAPPPDLRYDDSDTSSTTTSHDGTSSTPALSNSSTDGSEGGAEEDTTARLRAPSSLELVAGSSEPPPPPSEVQDESDTQFQRLKVEAPKIVPESHREHHDTDAAAATSFDSPFDTENDGTFWIAHHHNQQQQSCEYSQPPCSTCTISSIGSIKVTRKVPSLPPVPCLVVCGSYRILNKQSPSGLQ